MFKISYLRLVQNQEIDENQEINIERFGSSATNDGVPFRRKPLFPYALSGHSAQSGWFERLPSWGTDRDDSPNRRELGQTFRAAWNQGITHPAWTGAQNHYGLFRRRGGAQSYRIRPAKCTRCQGSLAEYLWQGSERIDIQTFFIHIGARYRRIRKRPKGKPSPQLYAYKTEKLQELETLFERGEIDLFYGDESHVCTEGYVPYGWQFPGEEVYTPVEKAKRLNVFGMIDRNNRFQGFCTSESVDAQKVVEFLDHFSFKIGRKTFVVLDNASVHRNEKIRRMRTVWEKRGLFLFYIPPYSPHLNIVETLWRIMKGKWLRPQDYVTTESLFYATNRALAAIGTQLKINFRHYAA